MLVIVAPGQGAQSPGFLTPWLEDPTFASRFEWLSTVADLDLAHYGTEADAETIRDTKIAQPLLVATGLIAALELFPHPADAFSQIGAVAGHSVGEIAAAAGARAITAEQAMVLVRERGNAMAAAAIAAPRSRTSTIACSAVIARAPAAAASSPTLCPATAPIRLNASAGCGKSSRATSRPEATSSGWATAVSRIVSASDLVPWCSRSVPAQAESQFSRSVTSGRSSQGSRNPGLWAP